MSKRYDIASPEANLIYETLMKHYPAEIQKIQMQAANDMELNGFVSENTDKKMDALMERVVEDNKRMGRT